MCQKITQTLTSTLLLLFCGCSSPLNVHKTTIDPVIEATAIVESSDEYENLDTQISLPIKEATTVEKALQHRIEEITKLTPANIEESWESNIGINLHHKAATATQLSMDEAIFFAIENNIDIQIASLNPSITEQSTVAEEAAFDFLFGAGASSSRSNKPQQQIVVGGVPINSAESTSDTIDGNISLAKQLYGGGTITLSTNITKTNNSTTGTTVSRGNSLHRFFNLYF